MCEEYADDALLSSMAATFQYHVPLGRGLTARFVIKLVVPSRKEVAAVEFIRQNEKSA